MIILLSTHREWTRAHNLHCPIDTSRGGLPEAASYHACFATAFSLLGLSEQDSLPYVTAA